MRYDEGHAAIHCQDGEAPVGHDRAVDRTADGGLDVADAGGGGVGVPPGVVVGG